MRTLKLTIAYDGTEFGGWQVQANRRTVQGTLEEALSRITGCKTNVVASGRTDAGVHALGQVASFRTESRLSAAVFHKALNAQLPPDVAVLEAVDAPAEFHALRDTLRKRYRYAIDDGPQREVFRRRYAWHCFHRLDVDAMDRAARMLVGTHDFSSFETSGAPRRDSIRTVFDLCLRRNASAEGPRITLEIEADGFLYNMVRTIVGTLVEVGRGARPEAWVGEVLTATDRRVAGPTAPPEGLFLVNVTYPDTQGTGESTNVEGRMSKE